MSRDGHALFPMMPYGYFRNMCDEDARAIVACLGTLRPSPRRSPGTRLAFPTSLLVTLAPRPLDGPVAAPDPSDGVAHGRYPVDLAGCMECHTERDWRQRARRGREFAGGWRMEGPWGVVVSTNITPDAGTWLGRIDRAGFIARFRSFAPIARDPPPAPRGRSTIMPWLACSRMSERDLGATCDYLRTVPPVKNEVDPFPEAE